jgi:2'-5' RNA ligase
MIRAFVGIPVPAEITRMLTGVQIGLKHGRLVPPENFHITLAFLGEHPEPNIEDVHTLLDGIHPEEIHLEINGLGVFGGEKPRLLFAEVVPNKALNTLRKRVRTAAREAGIDLEHSRYHPHITLARFGSGLIGGDVFDLQQFISARMARTRGAFTAAGFNLFESRLGSEAPHYSVLAGYGSATES